MGLLKTLPALLLASACYSPDVGDCTVPCHATTDCAPNQVCGSDGYCAAADVAGTCARIATVDGKIADAGRVDAATPDAPPRVQLVVAIDGRGDVTSIAGDCSAGNGQLTCMFDVPKGVPITLVAKPKNGWRFDKWQDACAGQPTTTCVVTPTTTVTARVRFVED